MRVLAAAALLAAACATSAPRRVAILHGDPDSAREAADVLARAGFEVEAIPAADLPADEIPDWVDPGAGGWVVFGRPADRARAEKVLEKWQAGFEKREAPRPTALALGTRRDVPDDEAAAIRAELARRRETDQAVRKNPFRRGEMPAVDADNTAYLKGVVTDVGWIDVERFGREAANAAFLIVQHSGDVPLMLAALPEIEEDVRAGRADAQNFALLYDRTQLFSGGKQRYGTQVGQNDAGEWVVLRLEDPDRVDERRRELGLRPLREYLKLFGDDVAIER